MTRKDKLCISVITSATFIKGTAVDLVTSGHADCLVDYQVTIDGVKENTVCAGEQYMASGVID